MPGMGISRDGDLCEKNFIPPLLFIDTQQLRTKRKSLTQTMQSQQKNKISGILTKTISQIRWKITTGILTPWNMSNCSSIITD
jgi:hypothetical protein